MQTMDSQDIYAAVDPRQLPAYTLADAARFLGINPSTLHSWTRGRASLQGNRQRFSKPLLQLPEKGLLSFENLIEAHALHAIRTRHEISMAKVRIALEYAETHEGIDRLLLSEQLLAGAGDLFIDKLGELINLSRSGQLAIRQVLRVYLERVERDERGLASRFYPLIPGVSQTEPKAVVIDPRLSFGRPSLSTAGISTFILAERFDAGESLEDLAEDYGVELTYIRQAIQYEGLAA
jgi:uncharacterized protein (DUF433 family)